MPPSKQIAPRERETPARVALARRPSINRPTNGGPTATKPQRVQRQSRNLVWPPASLSAKLPATVAREHQHRKMARSAGVIESRPVFDAALKAPPPPPPTPFFWETSGAVPGPPCVILAKQGAPIRLAGTELHQIRICAARPKFCAEPALNPDWTHRTYCAYPRCGRRSGCWQSGLCSTA